MDILSKILNIPVYQSYAERCYLVRSIPLMHGLNPLRSDHIEYVMDSILKTIKLDATYDIKKGSDVIVIDFWWDQSKIKMIRNHQPFFPEWHWIWFHEGLKENLFYDIKEM